MIAGLQYFFKSNKEKNKVIQAVTDRVFIRLPEESETTEGGIIIRHEEVNERTVGEVISVGDKVKSVKVGDKVLFHIFDDLPSPDKNIVVVRENSILGVFENE